MALILVIAGSVFAPEAVLGAAAAVGVYAAARSGMVALAARRGRREIRHWESIDWRAEYVKRVNKDALPWESVHHAVIVCAYNEPEAILRGTLEHLAGANGAGERITVVLAMEGAEPGAAAKGERLRSAFAGRFAGMFVTVHPAGLPGEVVGKTSNEAWAARWLKRKLVDEGGRDIRTITVTSADADSRPHPRYFDALTCLFATDPGRHHAIWQAPIRYEHRAGMRFGLLRAFHAAAESVQLGHLMLGTALPLSTYSASLALLDRIDYWDADVIAEDWHIFIKAFFRTGGRAHVRRVMVPCSVRAAGGGSLREVAANRYTQTLRHAWGSRLFGDVLRRMRGVSGAWLAFRTGEDALMAGAGWIVAAFGGQLSIILHPGIVLPPALILSMAALAVTGAACILPGARSKREALEMLISALLLPPLSPIFLALPVLHAQTMLLLGQPLIYKVTPR